MPSIQPTIAKTSLYGNDETTSWSWSRQFPVDLGGDKTATLSVTARVVRIGDHFHTVDLGVGWTHRAKRDKYRQTYPGIPEAEEKVPLGVRIEAQEALREAVAWLAKEVA